MNPSPFFCPPDTGEFVDHEDVDEINLFVIVRDGATEEDYASTAATAGGEKKQFFKTAQDITKLCNAKIRLISI